MKKLILLIFFFGLINKTYCQNYQINSLKKVSSRVLLDSICNYLLLSKSVKNNYYYSADGKIFSNQLIDKGGMNSGYISIDTLGLTIRFNYTGTSGSGGFSPYIQQTFYFQDFASFDWKEKNDNNIILHLESTYDNCKGNQKPIAEFEITEDCRYGESPASSEIPDYTTSWFHEKELVYNKDKMTDVNKDKLSNWLNEIKTR